ncbi:hypothetical protein EDC96DRAFT_533999 [Choanephora cucurbitarum]|nr:hypothetical protein EDC96DRAFT_533999 [Choanephora cucurbitarum]
MYSLVLPSEVAAVILNISLILQSVYILYFYAVSTLYILFVVIVASKGAITCTYVSAVYVHV